MNSMLTAASTGRACARPSPVDVLDRDQLAARPLTSHVIALRALVNGEGVQWEEALVDLRRGEISGVQLPVRVPIRMAGHGPKGDAAASRSADGIVTNRPTHSLL